MKHLQGIVEQSASEGHGELTEGSEHSFLGGRLKHNGNSTDVSMSPSYIDTLLDTCGTQKAKCVQTTGSAAASQAVSAEPLSKEARKLYRAAVGKLLWIALICGDISCATKELSRDVTAPTEQSLAKLKHLLPCVKGTRLTVLRLRPHSQIANGQCALDTCSRNRTRKGTSGSTVSVPHCCVMATSQDPRDVGAEFR